MPARLSKPNLSAPYSAFLTPVSTTLSLRFGRLARLPPGRWSAVLSRFLAPRRAGRAAAPPALPCLGGTLCDPISSRPAAAKAGASASLTGSPLARSNAAVQRDRSAEYSTELLAAPRLFCQIGQNFAQFAAGGNALREFQAQHSIAASKVQSVWIESSHAPSALLSA